MNIKKALIKTKKILKQRGRTHVSLLNDQGCVCLLGAVGLAAGVPESDLRAGLYAEFGRNGVAAPLVSALIDELGEDYLYGPYDSGYEDLYSFNDSTDDDDEVFDLIDRAIEAVA